MSIIFLFALFMSTEALQKPNNLSLLQIFPVTHEGCSQAIQVAVNEVNSRSDVLPDYNLVTDFRDEEGFFLGYAPIRELVRHGRSWENRNSTSASIRSPIMVGPFFSIACKPLGRGLHHFDMVAIAIACTAPFLADHISYPNLYLASATGELIAMSLVHFIKDVGKWSRIAIISSVSSPNDYAAAIFIERYAAVVGVRVPYFNVILDTTDEVFFDLAANDIRVVVVYITEGPRLWKFLCWAHRFGMRGSKYVFIMNNALAGSPYIIRSDFITEPWCSRGMLAEMIGQSIFVGTVVSVVETARNSELGYNTTVFDDRFADLMPVGRKNKSLTAGSQKYVCHDSALMAIYALHDANVHLKQKFNSSLLAMTNQSPRLLSKVVNDSVLRVNRSGLRGQLRFSERGYNENDKIVYQWWDKDKYVSIHYSEEVPGARSEFSHGKYAIRTLSSSFNWSAWTSTGRPPKDSSSTVYLMQQVTFDVFYSVLTIACLLSICQLGVIVMTINRKHDPDLNVSRVIKVFGYCGCLLLNVSAVLFATSTSYKTSFARLMALVTSISATNAVIGFRAIFLARKLPAASYRNSSRISLRPQIQLNGSNLSVTRDDRRPSQETGRPSALLSVNSLNTRRSSRYSEGDVRGSSFMKAAPCTKELEEETDRSTITVSIAFVVVNGIVVLCWLFFDSYSCSEHLMLSESYYDVMTDTKYQISEVACGSEDSLSWIGALAASHFVILFYSLYQSYTVKRRLKTSLIYHCRELPAITICCVNAVTLIAATALVIVTLDGQVKQQIAISFGSLLLSASTSLFWSYLVLKNLKTIVTH